MLDGSISQNVLWTLAAIAAVLAAGTVMRLTALRFSARRDTVKARLDSLKSWWGVAIAVFGAALLGETVTVLLFAVISGLALREFALLPHQRTIPRQLLVVACVLLPFNYLWIWLDLANVFVVFLPLAAILLLALSMILVDQAEHFVGDVSCVLWGLLLTVYCPAYAVLWFSLQADSNPVAGVMGWFLFLVILTTGDDIAQALVGRQWGRRKLAPRISPGKTWEGFLGGTAATVVLAGSLAPVLTPLGRLEAALAGLLISLAGMLGDLNMSAMKRDVGVKDTGSLLPGQGGILDRIDSLIFAAPVFYYLVVVAQGAQPVLPE